MSNLALNNQETLEKIQSYLETMNMTANLTKAEIKQFVEIASSYGLNPFKREIYASKFGNSFSIIVGFETYLKRAERSGKLSGWSVTTDGDINYQDIAKSNVTATITIYRKDWSQPFVHSVHFGEYVQKRSDGTVNKFWKEKPMTMIKKVAMAQGFRLCFSDENGGLPYTSEEIGREETIDTQAVVVPASSSKTDAPAVKAEVVESTKKAGRPKKQPEAINPEALYAKIKVAMDIPTLLEIYNTYPQVQASEELMKVMGERKEFILWSQNEHVKAIDKAATVNEIMGIIMDTTDEAVLSYAKTKIDELEKQTNHDLF